MNPADLPSLEAHVRTLRVIAAALIWALFTIFIYATIFYGSFVTAKIRIGTNISSENSL